MAGYSGTPLAQKLGIKAGHQIHVAGAPMDYRELVAPLPAGVELSPRVTKATALVHLFTARKSELASRLEAYRARLAPAAAVWVSWPKKASKLPTDVSEDVVREVALPLGFVDVKVCAVDEVWSGLKLVVRKGLR